MNYPRFNRKQDTQRDPYQTERPGPKRMVFQVLIKGKHITNSTQTQLSDPI